MLRHALTISTASECKEHKRLQAIIRGYWHLQQSSRIGYIRRLRGKLVDTRFASIEHKASAFFYGNSIKNAELLTRQYLLRRNSGVKLNRAVFYSIGNNNKPIIYPLPNVWQNVLIGEGLKINRVLSIIAWSWFILIHWWYGIFICLKLVAITLLGRVRNKDFKAKRFAYFDGLTAENLPQPGSDNRSYDICTWYSFWNERADNLEALCHSVPGNKVTYANGLPVVSMKNVYPPLDNYSTIMRLLFWSISAIGMSALDAMRGRWWHALLLAESAKAKLFALSKPGFLARDYLFYYSGTVYRPMWTYEVEARGSRVICYFYALFEEVNLPEGYESKRYELGGASWPLYLVWDKDHADLVRREIDDRASTKVVGPIWFTTSDTEMPDIPERSIAVFDIQPHRHTVHFPISTQGEWFAKYPDLQIQFLKDVHKVLSEYGITMVLKRKRVMDKKRSVTSYVEFLERLSGMSDVIIIDPRISAIKVIENCKAVISMPLTSAAHLMGDRSVPSVYYDPTSWVRKDEKGAHGLPILLGINELRAWIESLLKKHSQGQSAVVR